MAFRQLNKQGGAAITLDAKTKTVQGYLMGLQAKVGDGKGKLAKSRIYELQGKDGERFTVWGSASVNPNLCADKDYTLLDDTLKGRMVRLTYTGLRKIKGQKNPMKVITVEVDLEDTIKPGKVYVLKK